MEEGPEIERADPHDAIVQLEQRIEELTAKIENCRKFILASIVAIVLGGLLLLPGIVGAVQGEPVTLIAAVVAVISGIVVSGSNSSTKKEAAAQLVLIKARHAALIGDLDLRVVSDWDGAGVRQ